MPAILGSYPEGPETQDGDEAAGRWSPWRRENSSPLSIWQQAQPALERVIARQGFVRCYVYYGQNLPVELVYRIDALRISPQLAFSPGLTFDFAAQAQAHVWVRYAGQDRIRVPIPRDDFRELPLADGQFATESVPISQGAWLQMFQTGLIFVGDRQSRRR